MVTLRTIAPHERGAVLDLLAGWLNDRAFFERYLVHDPSFRDDLCFVAEDDGRPVSTLQVFRKLVRVDGATLAVGGVANVYTDPALRAAGLATALLERAIAAMAAEGFDVSLLFATRLEFYGRLGWRSARRLLTFIDPGGPSADVQSARFDAERDLGGVRAVYDAHSLPIAGATLRDARYWSGQLRYAGNPDERFLLARRGGRVVAYARAASLYEFNTVIEHGCLPGEEAELAELLLELHAGATTGTLAQLAPSAALAARLAERGLTIRTVDDQSAMWRVIDPERLAATLRLSRAAVMREDFFTELLPAERSRYWLSDRF
jgi:GNAT superfamily N-acetyltransferase